MSMIFGRGFRGWLIMWVAMFPQTGHLLFDPIIKRAYAKYLQNDAYVLAKDELEQKHYYTSRI